MATRSGTVDPGLVIWLLEHVRMPPAELASTLEHRSGLLGLAGTADMRSMLAAADAGDDASALARDVYVHRLRGSIAAMTAAMGGLDVLLFTGGVGENSPAIRALATDGLGYLGVGFDAAANASAAPDAVIGPHRRAGAGAGHPGARGPRDRARGARRPRGPVAVRPAPRRRSGRRRVSPGRPAADATLPRRGSRDPPARRPRPRRPRPPAAAPASGPGSSTTIARICVPSVQAACSTSGGQRTASPAWTRARSSSTPTQPPPSITTNHVWFGFVCGVIRACRPKASSATTPYGLLSMTCPSMPVVPGGPSGRRCPTPNRRISIGIGRLRATSGGGAGERTWCGSCSRAC